MVRNSAPFGQLAVVNYN